ncbi:MDR family MFS transporter [Streptomyces sp. NPDC006670]|uniref:MDR family MFS transporter n=1 Tax=Streptomyces sp. NPDC006670 TaxID=3154476 RepID=UPI0033DD05C4
MLSAAGDPRSVTMDDIGRGTLYRRYPDVTSIAAAFLDEHERRLLEDLLRGAPPLGPGPPPRDVLGLLGSPSDGAGFIPAGLLAYFVPVDQLIAADPTHIGPYRLIARLGEGGMGLVYLGRSEGGRTVAVKVVQAEYAGHAEFRRRFAREVAAARRVGGDWTAAVLDADPEAAVPWVATQYIPGPDLRSVVAEDFGPLPEYSVHTLANRLAVALRAVHEAGLIHRDLKPSNVLVTIDGPRVIDFGIARAMDSLTGDSLHTRTGMLIGSPGFMSPEQVRGRELTPASDVFCLGAVLVYASTGRLLFGADDSGLNAHLFRVAEEEPDLTGVPQALTGLVRACLEKDPAARPTPQEVADRTAVEQAGEWLPGTILAQLGRRAARLLDWAPETPAAASQRDPRIPSVPRQHQHQPVAVPAPPYAPTPTPPAASPAAEEPVAAQGFGPPPAVLPDPAAPHPRRWWGLGVIALTQLLVLLDVMGFSTALPTVEADLGVADDGLNAVTAYAVAFAGLLLPGGYLCDRVGAKRALITGLAGFALASALCGSAGGPGLLMAARGLQGAFAALLAPAALSLVSTGFTDPGERARAFGIYGAVTAGGGALGLLTGGWLAELASWRMSQFASVPLAALAAAGAAGAAGAAALLPGVPPGEGGRFDGLGVLFGSAGLAALAYGTDEGGRLGWTSPLALGLVAAGVLLLAAFLRRLTATTGPLSAGYPGGQPDRRDRLGCALTMVLTGAGFLALLPTLTVYLQYVIGSTPGMTGVMVLPLAFAAVIAATQVSARLQDRVAPGVLIVSGLVTAAAGTLLLAGIDSSAAYGPRVLPGMLLAGFGGGLAFGPLFATATAGVALRGSGAASAVVLTAQQVGESIGGALLVTLIGARLADSSDETEAAQLMHGYSDTLWWAGGSLLLAALTAGSLIKARAPRAGG